MRRWGWAVSLLVLFATGCWLEPWPGTGSGPALCENTCRFAGDGDCDDGGEGADYSLCAYGSDCDDCGPRGGSMMSIPADSSMSSCPRGCDSNEVCVRDYGCAPLCSRDRDCSTSCCASLTDGRGACLSSSACP